MKGCGETGVINNGCVINELLLCWLLKLTCLDTIKHRSPLLNGVDIEVEVSSVVNVVVMVDVVIVVVGYNQFGDVDVDAGRKDVMKQVLLVTVVS